MKSKLLSASILLGVLFLNFSYAQQTYLPDDFFEQYLIDQGYDTVLDNYVSTSIISNIDTIDINGINVTDLTGLKDFTALTHLDISSTLILNLDVSANTALISLNINDTSIASLDLNTNTSLDILYADNTLLSSLDVSTNTALTILDISNTSINSIDVGNNTSLMSLSLSETSIVKINLNSNTALTYLSIVNTPISSLDVSNNTVLTTLKTINTSNLFCISVADEVAANTATGIYTQWEKDTACGYSEECDLTYVPDNIFEQYLIDEGYDTAPLDDFVPTANIRNVNSVDLNSTNVADLTGIEDFSSLTTLDISNSSVNDLNVSNNTSLTFLNILMTSISSLDVSFNTVLTSLNTVNTINLDCITVADETAATNGTGIYFNWTKDEICSYSTNCNRLLSDIDFNTSEIFVGPNPIRDELQIKLNNTDVLKEVSLFDISGKLILKSANTTISTSHLEKGLYLVKITTDKGSFTRKLVK